MNKIVVFAPHPDDEILCCGGTIIEKLKKGYDISIVYMTDGRNALCNLGVITNPSPFELKDIRRKEAIRGANLLGVTPSNLYFLDVEDTKLNYDPNLINIIRDLLNSIKPQEIYLPSIEDATSDHKNTNLIVMSSLKMIKLETKLYSYISNPKYARLDYLFKLLHKIFDKRYIENNISDHLSQKYFSLLQHKSQIIILNPKQRQPVISTPILQRLLNNTESFICLNERARALNIYTIMERFSEFIFHFAR
jgi:LmbE family N-acetylglucosaminyl deacetylase